MGTVVALEVHQRMADVLGGPVRSLRKRWKNLERFMAHTPDVDWARLDDPEMDPVRMSPFPEEEEKIFIEKLENRSGISGYEKNDWRKDSSCPTGRYFRSWMEECGLMADHMKREFLPNNTFFFS